MKPVCIDLIQEVGKMNIYTEKTLQTFQPKCFLIFFLNVNIICVKLRLIVSLPEVPST